MAITAALVKELRERTGAGMMECKKALVETDGDIDKAIENMRKSGQAKAAKKAGRVAAEGIILIKTAEDKKTAAILEINCETDFVARDENFVGFANKVVDVALTNKINDVEALNAAELDGATVEETRANLVAKIGENMNVRRVKIIESAEGLLGSYRHGDRIGVVVELKGGDEELARDIAMHVAAVKPDYIRADEIPADVMDKEKEIFTAQALESGKPAEIVEKMIGGRLNKFAAEISLMGQPFVKEPSQTVEKLLKSKQADVVSFVRFEVGEGIEKKEEDFASEVMAQVRGE
ncbi:translation elongation factor Ts [Pleionea sp. CnH1-48]|uniref:translation elongation factor Ts n=1 Tax=Pleionea sp. CnH1-48 TaxID=2954494 RepID=UPI00209844EC|nr:translation elongation factor Ts [Pleionea sp. CnH1-48]MCO7226503.1 translation elongation factor Ts [Pleionea sp. CnH1-48]